MKWHRGVLPWLVGSLLIALSVKADAINPSFRVNPEINSLMGFDWPAGDTVSITIGDPDDPDFSGEADIDGDGFWDLWEIAYDIQVGDQVRVVCGEVVKEHEVRNLTISAVDADNHTISGTAESWSWVNVQVYEKMAGRYVQASAEGEWTADFSEPVGEEESWDRSVELKAGHSGDAWQDDGDQDATWVGWRLPRPVFRASTSWNDFWGHDWPAGETVTVTLLGEPDEVIGTAVVGTWGEWNLWDISRQIEPGQVYRAACGEVVKEHEVTALTITEVDPGSDTISGTAESWSRVDVEVWGENVVRIVEADASGQWTADFSAPVGEGEGRDRILDLQPGHEGQAAQEDEDGDATTVYWRIDSAHFNVQPRGNHLWGHEWPAGETITITRVGEPDEGLGTAEVDEWGDWWLHVAVDIQPHDLIRVECNGLQKEHRVTELEVTEVNPDADTVSGTAAPESWVDVSVHDDHVHARRYVQADAYGSWTADFSEEVPEEHDGHVFNIEPGVSGDASQRDEDGDATFVHWFAADPLLKVNIFGNMIWGMGWPVGATVHLVIGDPGDPDVEEMVWADEWGNWRFDPWQADYQIRPGDVIRADDGTHLRILNVPNLDLTGADPDLNTVSGKAPAHAWVVVRIDEIEVEAQADAEGDWTADFDAEGISIEEGTQGYVYFYDGEGNVAEIFWRYTMLDVEEVALIWLTYNEEHWFIFELEGEGVLNARFRAPSEQWYDLQPEGWERDWWEYSETGDSIAALETVFTPGEYRVEITHYGGVSTALVEVAAWPAMPNAAPVILAPEYGQSDVASPSAGLEWAAVADPNFNAIIAFYEGPSDDGEDVFMEVDPEEPFPTGIVMDELLPDRIYSGEVIFLNIEPGETGGEVEADQIIVRAIITDTVFSTNTDADRFDPVDAVTIRQGTRAHPTGIDDALHVEIHFNAPLKPLHGVPLFSRIGMLTPDRRLHTLFDERGHEQFGDHLYAQHDVCPGDGWFLLLFYGDDDIGVCTPFWFGEPGSDQPLPAPAQRPEIVSPPQGITEFTPDGEAVTNPVVLEWMPVTDVAVNLISVSMPPHSGLLAATETDFGSAVLPHGTQWADVAFLHRRGELHNPDGIEYSLAHFKGRMHPVTVGYALTYHAGPGGRLEGPAYQVVAPGADGEEVVADAEEGALFWRWDDGHEHSARVDTNVDQDREVTVFFTSAGGVPVTWYDEHDIQPGAGDNWSDVDLYHDSHKRMNLRDQYVADLIPGDSNSVFRVLVVDPGPPFAVYFEPGSTGRVYTLEYSDDLASHSWTNVPGSGPRFGFGGSEDEKMEDVREDAASRAYRVRVELP